MLQPPTSTATGRPTRRSTAASTWRRTSTRGIRTAGGWTNSAHELQPGEFGENLTVTGFTDEDVQVGDVIRVGGAVVQVTTPREPCFKLGIRMGDHRFPARFREANRMGFYLRVLEEGEIGAGDAVEIEERAEGSLTIAEFHGTYTSRRDDPAALRRMLAAPRLTESWREWVEKRLAEAT